MMNGMKQKVKQKNSQAMRWERFRSRTKHEEQPRHYLDGRVTRSPLTHFVLAVESEECAQTQTSNGQH